MTLIGSLLVAGFAAFMTGALGWRLEYEQAPDEALPIMHADSHRLRWIHWWMVAGVALTVSGLGGLAWSVSDAGTAVAAAAYSLGAALWVAALVFRLSVGEWAAEQSVATGAVPAVYPPLARWMSLCHGAHMMSAYLSAVPLGWSLARAGLIPGRLGWAGAIWGLGLAGTLLVPRLRFAAQPPFWAHAFTLAIGIALLI